MAIGGHGSPKRIPSGLVGMIDGLILKAMESGFMVYMTALGYVNLGSSSFPVTVRDFDSRLSTIREPLLEREREGNHRVRRSVNLWRNRDAKQCLAQKGGELLKPLDRLWVPE